jgi:hypothetical protein
MVHPAARVLPVILGWRVIRWVGLRSYSIYLWHWPVFVVTRPGLDVPIYGLPLLVLRLAITAVLAEASYRLVEQPIRNGALGRAWGAVREARVHARWRLGLPWVLGSVALVVLVSVLGIAAISAQPPVAPAELAEEPGAAGVQSGTQTSTVTVAAASTATPSASGRSNMKPAPLSTAAPPTARSRATSPTGVASPATRTSITATPVLTNSGVVPSMPITTPQPTVALSETQGLSVTQAPSETEPLSATASLSVTAIGDSVMRGAAAALTERVNNIVVDAMVSRQAGAAIRLLKDQHDARRLGSIVIVHIGNNGFFTAQQFDQMMQVLTDVPRVLFINLRVPRRWEQPNNAVLADGVKRYPNAELVDWYAASANRPELFTSDGVHLQPDGRRVYVELIAAQLAHSGQVSR